MVVYKEIFWIIVLCCQYCSTLSSVWHTWPWLYSLHRIPSAKVQSIDSVWACSLWRCLFILLLYMCFSIHFTFNKCFPLMFAVIQSSEHYYDHKLLSGGGLWELSSYCCHADRRALHSYDPHLSHSFILCCLVEGGKTLCCAGALVMDQIALDINLCDSCGLMNHGSGSQKETFDGDFGWNSSTVFVLIN